MRIVIPSTRTTEVAATVMTLAAGTVTTSSLSVLRTIAVVHFLATLPTPPGNGRISAFKTTVQEVCLSLGYRCSHSPTNEMNHSA